MAKKITFDRLKAFAYRIKTAGLALYKQTFQNKPKRWLWLIPIVCIILFIIVLPNPLFDKPYSTVVRDRDGQLLAAKIAEDHQWRFPPSDSIPYKYKAAAICFEDKRFHYHWGIDPIAMGRALYLNLKNKTIVSGGSTISMQVIRLAYDNPPRTIWQKLKEAFFAFRLECTYSKKEIFELYADHAPFGGNVVGLQAAAWRYFGRSPYDLSWAEAALLAILPNSPALIHIDRNRPRLLEKRNKLLSIMYQEEIIDDDTYQLAIQEPLPDQTHPIPMLAPHLLDQLSKTNKGEQIQTSIQAALQERINIVVQKHAKNNQANYINNIAVLIAEVKSGEVLAYVGNVYDPNNNKSFGNRVDVIQSPRSSGSILKPFLYAAMIDQGQLLPTTLVPDIPIQIQNFSPRNYNRQYDGAVPAHAALERSLNVPAVRMLQDFGLEKFHLLLRKLGMTTLTQSPDHYGLSLILGGAESTLWDICAMYASLGRSLMYYVESDGKYPKNAIRPLSLFHKPTEEPTPTDYAPIEAGAIFTTFQALADVNRHEEEATWKVFNSSRKVAWKTGTSYGHRDAWAIGITPEYVVGVWVGNASGEGRPTLTGVNYAAPVLFDAFARLPATSWFPTPYNDLEYTLICPQSGYRISTICPDCDTILAPPRAIETPICPHHHIIHVNKDHTYRVNANCASPEDIVQLPWFILPPSQEWFYKQRNAAYKSLPPIHPNCLNVKADPQMSLLYPHPYGTVILTKQLDGTDGNVVARATHRRQDATIYWHIDSHFIGQTSAPHHMPLQAPSGNHLLTITDQFGESLSIQFRIEQNNPK